MTKHWEDEVRPLSESLPMALLRARETTMRSFRQSLAQHDLTEQQWRVLRALATNRDGLEVRELAERTFLLGPSLSRILANLETRGLIRRLAVATDQRRAHIKLERKATELVRLIGPESEARYAEIESKFGSKRYGQLLRMLEDLASLDIGDDADRKRAS